MNNKVFYQVQAPLATRAYIQQIEQPLTYRQKVGWLIAAILLLKGMVAFVLDLGNDEAYYWLYSQNLKWNYFDHPPIVALWARLFTLNLWLQDLPGFIRAGSLLGGAAATWFVFKSVATFHSERAGWYAACLYNASFYAGITAGLFLMPDAPQMVFWTFSLWMLARIIKQEDNWYNWLLFALGAGLCIMSKVHGAFLYFGLGLFILLRRRYWLLKPQLYAAIFLSLLIVSPILIWNLQNNFVTYRFHSARVALDETVEQLSFFKEVLQQFLFNNPVNVLLIGIALVTGYKLRIKKFEVLTLYNCIAWPLAGSLLFVSLFRDATLPHWSGPAYVTLVPLAAVYLAQTSTTRAWRKWTRWSLGTFIITLISYTLLVQFYPGTLGKKEATDLGKGDNTLDVYGWEEAGEQFSLFYQEEKAAGRMTDATPIVCAKWWGAHVEYYFCQPQQLNMIGLGPLHMLHEYQWLNSERKNNVDLSVAYCIIPSDEWYDVSKTYNAYYNKVQLVNQIPTFRNGKPAHTFYIYRLSGWKGNLPEIKQVIPD